MYPALSPPLWGAGLSAGSAMGQVRYRHRRQDRPGRNGTPLLHVLRVPHGPAGARAHELAPGVREPSTRGPRAPVASGALHATPCRCAQVRTAKASASRASGSTPNSPPSITGRGANSARIASTSTGLRDPPPIKNTSSSPFGSTHVR